MSMASPKDNKEGICGYNDSGSLEGEGINTPSSLCVYACLHTSVFLKCVCMHVYEIIL